MLALTWLAGLLRRRAARLAATTAGVAIAVALLASIASFLSSALSAMTAAATHQVSVDWQVETRGTTTQAAVLGAVRADPHVTAALPVSFGDVTGLQATTGGTTQSTGAGVVVGVADGYGPTFPGELRVLTGDANGGTGGALLAQQTAANLHAGPGDTVAIQRAGLEPVNIRVDGVVDLPQADSLFQQVGAAAGAQRSAPPDNVMVIPIDRWHTVFDALAAARPESVRTQVHARLDHRLPHDPAAAFNQVSGAARHLEAAVAGGAAVGNNLGAALDAARKDSLYAQILFFLLGIPGVTLAGLLTATVAASGADRRRRDLALLRVRGATVPIMVRAAGAEAAAVAFGGAVLGLSGAAVVGKAEFGSATFGASTGSAVFWAAASVAVGMIVAGAALVVPAWRDARQVTVATSRQVVGPPRRPRWLRGGLDLWLLAAAGLVFWLTSRSGYQVVLVPEGLPTLSVNYWSLSGPLLFWAGSGLLVWRLADALFGPGRRAVAAAARPVAGGLAGTVAATLARHRQRLARPVALVALTVAFAASTAVFNATYHQQAGVDARLSNGADVTVNYPPSAPADPSQSAAIASVAGVRHVEPLMHRFAYVGADLQDMFGVRPSTVVSAGQLQNAYFTGGTASTLIARLGRQPDGLLVSAETVKDFQLNPGDALRLRFRETGSGQLTEVTFHFLGVVKEFPTAPRDSFMVANADYLATHSGNAGIDSFLVDTAPASPAAVAQRVRARLGPGPTVGDLVTTRRQVGSSLTSVDLSGLTRVELGFALLLAAAATGLVLALSLAERRRSFAIARALGASHRQVASFVRVEAALVTGVGLIFGAAVGWGLTLLLVKILTGVFDPPPAALAVPWAYLGLVGGLAAVAAIAAGELTVRAARRPVIETIRDL